VTRKQRFLHYWKATGVIPRWQLFGVYLLIIVAGAVGFARTSTIANNADNSANQTAALAKRTAGIVTENKRLADQIQQQRRDNIRQACEDQNDRHHDAVKTTLRLLAHPAVPDHQLTASQKQAQRRAVIIWVNAIVPHQNCDELVKEATRSP
jgi:hypothetical protein